MRFGTVPRAATIPLLKGRVELVQLVLLDPLHIPHSKHYHTHITAQSQQKLLQNLQHNLPHNYCENYYTRVITITAKITITAEIITRKWGGEETSRRALRSSSKAECSWFSWCSTSLFIFLAAKKIPHKLLHNHCTIYCTMHYIIYHAIYYTTTAKITTREE